MIRISMCACLCLVMMGCASTKVEYVHTTMPDGSIAGMLVGTHKDALGQDVVIAEMRDYRGRQAVNADGQDVEIWGETRRTDPIGRIQRGFLPSTINTMVAGGAQVGSSYLWGSRYGVHLQPAQISRDDSITLTQGGSSSTAEGGSGGSAAAASESGAGAHADGGTGYGGHGHGGSGGEGGTGTGYGGHGHGGSGGGGGAGGSASQQQGQGQQQGQQQDQGQGQGQGQDQGQHQGQN